MLRGYTQRFLNDEQAGGTVMGLLSFILLVGICGLAAVITDTFRSQAMLQATADASALAEVIDLPDDAAAVATPIAYSTASMAMDDYGTVLIEADPLINRNGMPDCELPCLENIPEPRAYQPAEYELAATESRSTRRTDGEGVRVPAVAHSQTLERNRKSKVAETSTTRKPSAQERKAITVLVIFAAANGVPPWLH